MGDCGHSEMTVEDVEEGGGVEGEERRRKLKTRHDCSPWFSVYLIIFVCLP